jgi:Tfp pilus assembly protein PilO
MIETTHQIVLVTLAKAGSMVSSVGIATIGLVGDSVGDELGEGTTQVVLATFCILLIICVIYLFNTLQKQQARGHKERDDREKRFNELSMALNNTVIENTNVIKQCNVTMQQSVAAVEKQLQESTACHDSRIRLEAALNKE